MASARKSRKKAAARVVLETGTTEFASRIIKMLEQAIGEQQASFKLPQNFNGWQQDRGPPSWGQSFGWAQDVNPPWGQSSIGLPPIDIGEGPARAAGARKRKNVRTALAGARKKKRPR